MADLFSGAIETTACAFNDAKPAASAALSTVSSFSDAKPAASAAPSLVVQ